MRIVNGKDMREPFVKNKKKRERARVRTEELLKKTATVGTFVPLKQTTRERTQEHSKNHLRGGEEVEEKEEENGKVQKKELVDNVQRKNRQLLYGEEDVPVRDKSWEKLEDGSFSLCCWSRTGFVLTLQQKDYYSFQNKFERFRFFLNKLADSNSNFVAAEFFFERFEFLVCSKFNHTPCGRTCACAVACLHPHNAISNVVASVTIHDVAFFYRRDVTKT